MSVEAEWAIRDFERRDQEEVRDLVQRGMAERWGDDFRPDANPDLDDIWQSYVQRGGEVVFIERRGTIVATGTLVEVDAHADRLLRMAVHPELRRQGLGRSVVIELIERSRRRGHMRLLVTTDPPWLEAIALYRSCGFELVGETVDAVHFSMDLSFAGQRLDR